MANTTRSLKTVCKIGFRFEKAALYAPRLLT